MIEFIDGAKILALVFLLLWTFALGWLLGSRWIYYKLRRTK